MPGEHPDLLAPTPGMTLFASNSFLDMAWQHHSPGHTELGSSVLSPPTQFKVAQQLLWAPGPFPPPTSLQQAVIPSLPSPATRWGSTEQGYMTSRRLK